MTRPNLSLEKIALTLAALGTSAVMMACAKSEPEAVQADKSGAVSASASAATPPPPPVPAEQKPTDTTAIGNARSGGPGATATAAAASAMPAPAKPMVTPQHGGTGQASCGAGTCTADMKKK